MGFGEKDRRIQRRILIGGFAVAVAMVVLAFLLSSPKATPPPPVRTPSVEDNVVMPEVTGLTEVRAVAAITDAGFTVTSQPEESETVASGAVIRTDPPGGSSVPPESRVVLFVSTGP